MAKYAAAAMSKNEAKSGEKGVIVLVSSVLAEQGQRGTLAYSATKAALNGLVLPMARDLGKYGIRCVAIAPGLFATPMSDGMGDALTERNKKDIPLGRLGEPQEFAHLAKVVVENGYLNGVRLLLSGG